MILNIYRQYVTSVSYPNLSQHALRFIALFGSTYCCEQFFSRMKKVETHTRSKLTDEHLSGILRLATSSGQCLPVQVSAGTMPDISLNFEYKVIYGYN